jgi:hypothetical protein
VSTYADPTQATVWFDGDAFRGPANGADPADPFASAPVSGVTTLSAFGAIKAGFAITPNSNSKDYDAWNNRSGATFLVVDGNTKTLIKFRASQMSKATILTKLRGGTIAETSAGNGIWKHTAGASEELALLLQLKGSDGVKKESFWIPRCKLSQQPEEVLDDGDLAGYAFEIEALAPTSGGQAVVPYTNWNPLA